MRTHHYFNHSLRLDGAPYAIFKACQRIPGVESYWYDCHTPVKHVPKADLHVAVDWAEDATPFADYLEPHPTVYWISDTHCSEASFQFRLKKARRCDRVYVSILSDVERFAKEGVKVEWLPYAAEPLCYRPFPATDIPSQPLAGDDHLKESVERTYDVGFVGYAAHSPDRMEFLDAMFKRFPNHRYSWGKFFEDAAREMAMAKVVLNQSAVDSTNMRFFEALSGGNCQLAFASTDTGMLKAINGVHAFLYRSLEEAFSLAEWALAHPQQRQDIEREARKFILGGHTYLHRAYRLLDMTPPPEEDMRALILTWPGADTQIPMPVKGL